MFVLRARNNNSSFQQVSPEVAAARMRVRHLPPPIRPIQPLLLCSLSPHLFSGVHRIFTCGRQAPLEHCQPAQELPVLVCPFRGGAPAAGDVPCPPSPTQQTAAIITPFPQLALLAFPDPAPPVLPGPTLPASDVMLTSGSEVTCATVLHTSRLQAIVCMHTDDSNALQIALSFSSQASSVGVAVVKAAAPTAAAARNSMC